MDFTVKNAPSQSLSKPTEVLTPRVSLPQELIKQLQHMVPLRPACFAFTPYDYLSVLFSMVTVLQAGRARAFQSCTSRWLKAGRPCRQDEIRYVKFGMF